MGKYFQPSAWSQLTVGIGMLALITLVVLIRMANTIGLGKTLGKFFVFACIVAWVGIGVVLVIRGLNKM